MLHIPGKASKNCCQEPPADTGSSRGSQEEAKHVGWGRAQARVHLHTKVLPLIQTKQLLSPSAQISAPHRAEKPSKAPLRAWFLPSPLPRTPSDAQTAQSGPFPATPAGMGAQRGPVQSLPSVLAGPADLQGRLQSLIYLLRHSAAGRRGRTLFVTRVSPCSHLCGRAID